LKPKYVLKKHQLLKAMALSGMLSAIRPEELKENEASAKVFCDMLVDMFGEDVFDEIHASSIEISKEIMKFYNDKMITIKKKGELN